MRYMMIIKANRQSESGALPCLELGASMDRYNDAMVRAGVMLAGEGLHPTSRGVRVRFVADRQCEVSEGPFPDTGDLVAGFWLIDTRSREEAIEWAKRCPVQAGAEIELRPLVELADFAEARRGSAR
jgi:hypothetical protein